MGGLPTAPPTQLHGLPQEVGVFQLWVSSFMVSLVHSWHCETKSNFSIQSSGRKRQTSRRERLHPAIRPFPPQHLVTTNDPVCVVFPHDMRWSTDPRTENWSKLTLLNMNDMNIHCWKFTCSFSALLFHVPQTSAPEPEAKEHHCGMGFAISTALTGPLDASGRRSVRLRTTPRELLGGSGGSGRTIKTQVISTNHCYDLLPHKAGDYLEQEGFVHVCTMFYVHGKIIRWCQLIVRWCQLICVQQIPLQHHHGINSRKQQFMSSNHESTPFALVPLKKEETTCYSTCQQSGVGTLNLTH